MQDWADRLDLFEQGKAAEARAHLTIDAKQGMSLSNMMTPDMAPAVVTPSSILLESGWRVKSREMNSEPWSTRIGEQIAWFDREIEKVFRMQDARAVVRTSVTRNDAQGAWIRDPQGSTRRSQDDRRGCQQKCARHLRNAEGGTEYRAA